MTESEYVNVTNLAKARMVDQILRTYIPGGGGHDTYYRHALVLVVKLVSELEKLVHV